jgi:CHAT domain-containing protein
MPAARPRAGALALLHTPRYFHPCYSAGFALVGDAD